jgi:hypothetical protein
MLEIEEMSERHLPPELIRRLQVEELWARRHVLAEWMNADRLRTYYQHRAELRPASFPAVDVTWKEAPTRPIASIVPINAKRSLMPGG